MKRKRDIPIKFNISLLQLFDKWEIFHQNTRTHVFLKQSSESLSYSHKDMNR